MPGIPAKSRTVPLAAIAAGVALFGAACAANQNPPNVRVEQGGTFQVQVADSLNDAGRAPSVAVDQDGNPVVVYLLLKAKLKKGEIPPPVVAGQPQPPAVILATQVGGGWSRKSVTKQSTAPAKGEAEGLAFKDGTAGPPVHTGVAVDAQGKHHVAWSTQAGLFYGDDSAGTFGDPQKVTGGQTYGASIAVASDGTAWISFYQSNGLRVAHQQGSDWAVEDAAPGAGPAGGAAIESAVAVGSDGEPLVAYGDHGTTKLARRSGNTWSSEDIGSSGGYGVSVALDDSGNPRLAYYDQTGNVYAAQRSGTTKVATLKGSSGPSADWSTGIGVDDSGTVYVAWADTGTKQVMVASNREGEFSPEVLPDSLGGADPSLAVSPDGKSLAVAWYDKTNGDLHVATPAGEELTFAFSPSPAAPAASPSAPAAECQPNGTSLQITAPAGASGTGFDTNCLAAPAGKAFKVAFTNDDQTVHNWDLYTDSSATKHLGGAQPTEAVAPGDSKTFDVPELDPGQYFFRCDFHPTTMTGTFVVPEK